MFLLRPGADSPRITGSVRDVTAPDARIDFAYRVIRAWELPVEEVLAGGLGILPLAPVCVSTEQELAFVFRRMNDRLVRDTDAALGKELGAAAYILAGLRHPPELIDRVLMGVLQMEESATYQAILARGRTEGRAEGRVEGQAQGRVEGQANEARKLLLRVGRLRFGAPDDNVSASLARITDVARLESLVERALKAASWQELLASDAPGGRTP